MRRKCNKQDTYATEIIQIGAALMDEYNEIVGKFFHVNFWGDDVADNFDNCITEIKGLDVKTAQRIDTLVRESL